MCVLFSLFMAGLKLQTLNSFEFLIINSIDLFICSSHIWFYLFIEALLDDENVAMKSIRLTVGYVHIYT